MQARVPFLHCVVPARRHQGCHIAQTKNWSRMMSGPNECGCSDSTQDQRYQARVHGPHTHSQGYHSILGYDSRSVCLVCLVCLVFVASLPGWLAGFALLCFALLCFALLCFALLCFALLCFALLCFALLCFALLCFALLCFALLCQQQQPAAATSSSNQQQQPAAATSSNQQQPAATATTATKRFTQSCPRTCVLVIFTSRT